MVRRNRFAKQKQDRAGEDWTPEEVDLLIETALACGQSERRLKAAFPDRTWEAINVKIYKIVTGYRNEDRYVPGPSRTKRSGPLTRIERAWISKALDGAGQKLNDERTRKATKEHLARVLCRDTKDIKLPRRKRKGKGFGFDV